MLCKWCERCWPSVNNINYFTTLSLKNHIIGCFCAYVGQPQDHIGWATPMPFASNNPTNWRTNPWNFHKNFWRIGDFEKLSFFEAAILNYSFCFMKISPNLYGRMDGLKFWCFSWFPENSLLCVILRYTVYATIWNPPNINE